MVKLEILYFVSPGNLGVMFSVNCNKAEISHDEWAHNRLLSKLIYVIQQSTILSLVLKKFLLSKKQ